jgi:hypothetical protein
LRAENERLRADLEIERANYRGFLRSTHDTRWDNRQLRSENERLTAAITKAATYLEHAGRASLARELRAALAGREE